MQGIQQKELKGKARAKASTGVLGIIYPLHGHFEQNENSTLAPKYYSNIYTLEKTWDHGEIARAVKFMINKGSSRGNAALSRNHP